MNDHDRDMLDRLLEQYDTDTSNMTTYEKVLWKKKRRELYLDPFEAAGMGSITMKAKYLTKPKKKKCTNCQGDLPNTDNAPTIKSDVTGLEICPDCRVVEIIGAIRPRGVEV